MDSTELLDFSRKNVLITGAARGIGRRLAQGFSQQGATVIVHDRDEKLLKTVAQELGADYYLADLSSRKEIEGMLERLRIKYQVLHVLVNNAGMEIQKPVEEYTMAEYDQIMGVNLSAVFQLTQGVFPLLKQARGAAVLNISSVHERLPYPSQSVYCMSKAALGMFSKILAMEWAPYQIRVNSLAPGAIVTDMNRAAIAAVGGGKFASWIGSGRLGSVDDVWRACLFLTSELSSYVTGETLFADGGLSDGLLPYGQTPAMMAMRRALAAETS